MYGEEWRESKQSNKTHRTHFPGIRIAFEMAGFVRVSQNWHWQIESSHCHFPWYAGVISPQNRPNYWVLQSQNFNMYFLCSSSTPPRDGRIGPNQATLIKAIFSRWCQCNFREMLVTLAKAQAIQKPSTGFYDSLTAPDNAPQTWHDPSTVQPYTRTRSCTKFWSYLTLDSCRCCVQGRHLYIWYAKPYVSLSKIGYTSRLATVTP